MNETLECGHVASPHEEFTTGYGVDEQGKRHCYACCAERDRRAMIEDGRATLYLVKRTKGDAQHYVDHGAYVVTNWPGSLEFACSYVKRSPRGGGFGSQRTDAWFTGPDGKNWHAVNRGDMDIARCQRVKS